MTAGALRLAGGAWLVCALAACEEPPRPGPPDGGPPLALDVLDPPGSQIGLAYGQAIPLRVRYRTDDAAQQPLTGQPITFSIFGDPEGSTLAAASALTDATGLAQVTLTGGGAEASFRVTASAVNAPNATFSISVSKIGFVELDVQLAWPGPPAATTLRALLYDDHACAALPTTPSAPTAFRALSGAAPSTTLSFRNLLSKSYALVGRAEDTAGHPVAGGCVDIDSALVPAGSVVAVPLPLTAVVPSLGGAFDLATDLAVTTPAPAALPWHALTDCPDGVGSALLDALLPALSAPLAAALAAHRGALDSAGCRPATAAGDTSLDAVAQGLLTATGSPGALLPAIVGDLDALSAHATLTSRLTIGGAGAGLLTADHALVQLTLGAAGGPQAVVDVVAAGAPIVAVQGLIPTFDGAALTVPQHGFTLRLPLLWRDALAAQSIAVRLPAVTPSSTRTLVGAVVAAASAGAVTGCAAVEARLCTASGAANCTGALVPACTSGLDRWAATLDAGFAPTGALDFVIAGACTAADSDGDLAVDHLNDGVWTTDSVASATFTGVLAP